ncbi:MAG: tetratricopeptide repeat protein [Ramlibacter sp.]
MAAPSASLLPRLGGIAERRRPGLRWGAALALAAAAAAFLVQGSGTPEVPASDASALALEVERALQGASGPLAAGDRYAQLELQLQRHPDDVRALVLKARLDMEAQRFDLAAGGYGKALGLPNSKAVRDPDVWAEYAEAVGMQQGGTLAGKPMQLVDKALALDPRHAKSLDLAGSAAWEARDFAAATDHWKRLLERLPPGSSRHGELAAAIRAAEQRARLALPAGRPR